MTFSDGDPVVERGDRERYAEDHDAVNQGRDEQRRPEAFIEHGRIIRRVRRPWPKACGR